MNVEMVVRGLVVKVSANLRPGNSVSSRDGVGPVFPQFLEQGKVLATKGPDGLEVLAVNNPDQVEVLVLLAAPLEIRQNDKP